MGAKRGKLNDFSKFNDCSKLKIAVRSLLSVICAGCLAGCSASDCDVEVFLDPEIKVAYGQVPTLEVDIAGVNAAQAQRLQKMDLDTYFTPNSPQRKSLLPLTMRFSDDNLGPMVLDDDDDIWERWKERGAQFIAVICNLPQFLTVLEDSDSQGAQGAGSGNGSSSGSGGGGAMLAGEMAEMANENSAVFNEGRVLLINMHDGFIKDSSEHFVQITVDGLVTLEERPEHYLRKEQDKDAELNNKIRSVQDLKRLEEQEQWQLLDAAPDDAAAQGGRNTAAKGEQSGAFVPEPREQRAELLSDDDATLLEEGTFAQPAAKQSFPQVLNQ